MNLPEVKQIIDKKGYEFVNREDVMMSSTQMSENFIKHMDKGFEMWKPKKRFTMYKS